MWKDAGKLRDCGKEGVVYCGGGGHPRLIRVWCELSICPQCARRHAAIVRGEWLRAAQRVPTCKGYRWRLVTLTLRASGDLRADYYRLLQSFSKLRRRWERRYLGCGGFRSVEVGQAKNVHMHLLAYLPWVDQHELATEWEQITDGSRVVDIRLVRDFRNGVAEVCKYITKLSGARAASEIVEVYLALKRTLPRRAWGVCYGLVEHSIWTPPPCEICGSRKWYPARLVGFWERSTRGP